MAEVKNNIEYLCKYINLLLQWDESDEQALKPKYFRLAKYNKMEQNVANHLWQLLYEFIYPKRSYTKVLNKIDKVKLHFATRKYKSLDFYLITDEETGSREILIAFAWLISNTNILNQLVENRISTASINYEFPSQNYVEKQTERQLQLCSKTESLEYISVLINKINTNLRIKNDCDKQVAENMNKIHSNTKYDLDIPHLSVNDVFISKNPELQRKFMEENETVIHLLEAKTKWEDCQSIFWKWMITVLDEKFNERTPKPTNSNETLVSFIDLLKSEVHSKAPLSKVMAETEEDNSDVRRHVYHTQKFKKPSVQSDTALEMCSIRDMECKRLTDYWHHLDSSFESFSTLATNSAISLTTQLNGLLNENKMASC